ncbi:MAG: TlpA family protein disulfide reductase, partial [Myxococcales bacterium]|nr:TlpA family protein disulfide reductase [Myxococcales bacterium]
GARAADVRRPLPTTTVVGLDGTSASLADVVRGRVTVIDLWASWCTACRATSARVARLAKIYAATDLLVVGLDVGEDRDTVAAFLEGGPPPHPVYLDPDFHFADALGRRELPAVVFVDRHGTVRRVASTLDESGVDLARGLLAEP